MPDHPDGGLHIRAPAASCPSPAPASDGTQSTKAPNTPATHPSYQSARCAHATPGVPSLHEAARLAPFPNPALRPTPLLPLACPEPIRAALSNGAASPRKRSPAQNKDPGAPPRSSRDQQTCSSYPDGTPGTFRCDGSRCACRASPATRIFRAASLAWCAAQATPTPGRDNFRRRLHRPFQTAARAAPVWYTARGTPNISAPLRPCFPVSGCAPSVGRRRPSRHHTRGCACPAESTSNIHSDKCGCPPQASRCRGNSWPRRNPGRCTWTAPAYPLTRSGRESSTNTEPQGSGRAARYQA